MKFKGEDSSPKGKDPNKASFKESDSTRRTLLVEDCTHLRAEPANKASKDSKLLLSSQKSKDDLLWVLVVDDSLLSRKILSKCIQRIVNDCQIIHAENGLQALEHLKTHPHIDMIVSDHEMPKMNGLELLEAMDKETFSTTAFILSSGNTSSSFITRALLRGASRFLKKPFSSEEFSEAFHQSLCARYCKTNTEHRQEERIVCEEVRELEASILKSSEKDPHLSPTLYIFDYSASGLGILYYGDLSLVMGDFLEISSDRRYRVQWIQQVQKDISRLGLQKLAKTS